MKCLVPTGILNLEEQRDVLFVIGGANPLGPLISTEAIPRKRIYLKFKHKHIYNLLRNLKVKYRLEGTTFGKISTPFYRIIPFSEF